MKEITVEAEMPNMTGIASGLGHKPRRKPEPPSTHPRLPYKQHTSLLVEHDAHLDARDQGRGMRVS